MSKHKPLTVLITGGRDWTDEDTIREELMALPDSCYWLVHGEARGADRIAARIGKELNFRVEGLEADWTRYGKAAGPIRNRELLRAFNPDLCLAFPTKNSVGTWDMVKAASLAGIRVIVCPERSRNPLKADVP